MPPRCPDAWLPEKCGGSCAGSDHRRGNGRLSDFSGGSSVQRGKCYSDRDCNGYLIFCSGRRRVENAGWRPSRCAGGFSRYTNSPHSRTFPSNKASIALFRCSAFSRNEQLIRPGTPHCSMQKEADTLPIAPISSNEPPLQKPTRAPPEELFPPPVASVT